MMIIMAGWTFNWSENTHCTDKEEVGKTRKTRRKMPMKHKTSFSLVFVSRIVIALAILFVALPVVGARSAESASVVETQDAFNAAASVPGARFVHTATATNTSGSSTYIDHPLTNENPNAIVLVTQNWNPGGISGVYNDHPIGVWYSNSAKKWSIFNQDIAAMPDGADFNVMVIVYRVCLPLVLRGG